MCQAGGAARVGRDGDLWDQVRGQRPAAGDEPGDVPGVLAVEPDHGVVEPVPQVVTELGVQAGCRLPGPRQQRVVAEGLLLLLGAVDGDVELAVGEADMTPGDGEQIGRASCRERVWQYV